ncbi:MAG: hypothetical protein ACOCRK_04500 [bacterium]
MKRLMKKALMSPEMLEGTIDQLGEQGREILKLMEQYKFKLEQAARITTNDQNLTQKIIQKKKMIDNAAGQIYSVVFDIENIDITQAYEEQQLMGVPGGPMDNNVNDNVDNMNPNGPATPPPNDAPMNDEYDEFDEEEFSGEDDIDLEDFEVDEDEDEIDIEDEDLE